MKVPTIVMVAMATAVIVDLQFAAPSPTAQDIHIAARRAVDDSRSAAAEELQRLVASSQSLSVMYAGVANRRRRESRLGSPVALFDVHVAQLQRFGSGVDPIGLLMLPTTVFYPVLIDHRAIGILDVARSTGGRWKVASRGRRTLAASIVMLRAGFHLPPDASTFVVSIPSLNQLFLAVLEENRLRLQPLANHAEQGFRAGQAQDAAMVFSRLKPVALRWRPVGPG